MADEEGFKLGDLWPGGPSNRPDHPDFWRLVEIVQEYDIRMDDATPENKEAVFKAAFDGVVDLDSLGYMAMQRAMRVVGVRSNEEVRKQAGLLAAMATLYFDAFLMGAQFQQRGGHRAEH